MRTRSTFVSTALTLLLLASAASGRLLAEAALRPPAVPLVVHDPYFSIWSRADHLTDDVTRHWTMSPHSLASLIRVDDQAFRLMGAKPEKVPVLPQLGLKVLPTQTVYDFGNEQVRVTLTFLTPALPEDIEILSRPLTYIVWSVTPADGKPHKISLYLSAGSDIVVDKREQAVSWQRVDAGKLTALRIGSEEQPVLQKAGDDRRIDWGYLYLSATSETARGALGSSAACADAFASQNTLPTPDDTRMPRRVDGDDMPAAALIFDLGTVSEVVSRHAMLAYDEVYSINYFGEQLRPYWRRHGMDAAGLLQAAENDYPTLQARCLTFDHDLMADLTRVGGEKYAELCALVYRQTFAGNGLAADANGQPLLFPKENTSNGCIGTVDVIYPMMPQLLLFNPTLAKAALVPVLNYASSPHWKFPFAPHDIGTYPKATGQVYGGGEAPSPSGREGDKMPVEESGNMILLVAAIAKIDDSPDFASHWWPLLTKWAAYLESKGVDPENQLCTDDFAGHLAHNTNLSIKAISALGAYGYLAGLRGEQAAAEKYLSLARDLAHKWMEAASDGDHYRIAFDQRGTWSQKYNMIWDKVLGTNIFSPEIAEKEMAFYKTRLERYGLPLDSRKPYVELPWSIWTASLTGKPADFEAISAPVYDYVGQTQSRVPLADFYWTQDAKEAGMHARPVLGGLFMKMLLDMDIWEKWAQRDKSKPGEWAPMPDGK